MWCDKNLKGKMCLKFMLLAILIGACSSFVPTSCLRPTFSWRTCAFRQHASIRRAPHSIPIWRQPNKKNAFVRLAMSDDEEYLQDKLRGSVLSGKQNVFQSELTAAQRKIARRLGEELMQAVFDNDVDKVKQICAVGEEGIKPDPDYSDEFGFSCMHAAAKRGKVEMIRALVDAGADINLPGEGSAIPLHIAAQYGRLEAVQAMVEMDADVDWKDIDGCTPLRIAEQYGKTDVAAFLRPLKDTGSGRWSDNRGDGMKMGEFPDFSDINVGMYDPDEYEPLSDDDEVEVNDDDETHNKQDLKLTGKKDTQKKKRRNKGRDDDLFSVDGDLSDESLLDEADRRDLESDSVYIQQTDEEWERMLQGLKGDIVEDPVDDKDLENLYSGKPLGIEPTPAFRYQMDALFGPDKSLGLGDFDIPDDDEGGEETQPSPKGNNNPRTPNSPRTSKGPRKPKGPRKGSPKK